MKVELWTIIGSVVTLIIGKVTVRFLDWYFPKGHHSKRVSRYAVKDETAEDDTTTEDTPR